MIIVAIIAIILDQLTKYWAVNVLQHMSQVTVIPNFFRLIYVENAGAAFGILQDRQIFFIFLTVAVLALLLVYYYKHRERLSFMARLSLGMIVGGAIGNFIDRVRFGYVIDMLSFRFFNRYNFAVFNIADSFIVVGTILLMILIFIDKVEVDDQRSV